jgi:copper oxidase (laccase) domain-containing protein
VRPTIRTEPLASRFFFEEAGAVVTVSTKRAGDLRPGTPEAVARCQEVIGEGAFQFTRQLHGAEVQEGDCQGLPGDGLVGRVEQCRPAMFAADCGLLGLVSPEGVVAAVHAGWRGLKAGVIEKTAAVMRDKGASALSAVRGPVIGPECYEFGEQELAELVAIYGSGVSGRTKEGHLALDLPAGIEAACERAEIELAGSVGACTACGRDDEGEPIYFSYRARNEEGRHGLFVTAL